MRARKSYQGDHKGRPGDVQEATKSKPTAKSLRHSLGGSDPVSCDCSRAIHKVRRRAILTVESSEQKPAYYLTFVSDASPMLTQTTPADTLGKQKAIYFGRKRTVGATEGKRGNAMGEDSCALP
jgi:hypothetical protein